MRVDVAFTPAGIPQGELAGRSVVVVDVLRATTTICAALHHGARAVLPASDRADAARLAQALDRRDVLLAGEREALRIEGFDLGNSPREMTPEVVAGKTVVMTTTNGTRALLGTAGAREVVVAAGANLAVASAWAADALASHGELLVLCAGREHGFGLDDAYVAGRLVLAAMGPRRTRKGLNDGAIAAVDLGRRYGDRLDRVLALSAAGRHLAAIGFRDDVLAAGQVDAHPVLPCFHDRRVTLAHGGRA